jgi:parallel beta-helix repeat protein
MRKITFVLLLSFVTLLLIPPVGAVTYIDSCQDLTQEGETYILTGNVEYVDGNKCFNITTNDVTLDCDGYVINHTGTYGGTSPPPGPGGGGNKDFGVYINGRNNIVIKNCKICHVDCSNTGYGLSDGIGVIGSSYITLTNNIIRNTIYTPILVKNSNHVTITGNTIPHGMGFCSLGNACGGITLFSSNSNTISNNEISNVTGIGCGIRIGDSSSNTITTMISMETHGELDWKGHPILTR